MDPLDTLPEHDRRLIAKCARADLASGLEPYARAVVVRIGREVAGIRLSPEGWPLARLAGLDRPAGETPCQ